jgi:integrase
MEALKAMKPFTFMKRIVRDKDPDVACDIFERPEWHPAKGSLGGKPSPAGPWMTEREQRDRFWNPSLRRCGVRPRRAYATRHTYCTVALMGRINPAYIALQAGHSVKTLLEKYARWIPGADAGREREALAAVHGTPDSSLALPQSSTGGNAKRR